GGNLLLLLAGWGMVGLSSYLLIGFYQERPSAIAAAKKAFVMNAFGDATMALALFLLIQHTRTLDYATTFDRAHGLSSNHWVVNLVALGLLGGAVAKSAQLPLQTWLPDAMEGPTPVSALIHAATMVTAGVYLIVRTHPLFELAPKVQDVAAGLGAATLVLAGLIALVLTDIKRVIAYSTMSQIGYMFLGAGLGAYPNAMFHLMTHAFFKALLFLGAGIVIHALMGEQDMRRMGGLRRLMPKTWLAMLVGGFALVGLPPFAGFFSKYSLLAAALGHGWYGVVLWICGLAGIGRAWWLYSARREPPPKPARVLEKKFYFDELYDALFYRPAVATARVLYALVEGPLIAGSVTGVSGATRWLGDRVRTLQTGLVRTYILAFAASLAVLAVVFVAVR